MPDPTPREAIEAVLAAVRITESGVERQSLLHAAIVALDRDAAVLPGEWAAVTRAETIATIEQNLRIDRTYDALVKRMIARAEGHARVADVRGVTNVLDLIRKSDAALGHKRPDAVSSAIAAVEAQLDVARRCGWCRIAGRSVRRCCARTTPSARR